MFKVVLIGHGEIAPGFLSAAEMIVGEQRGVIALPLSEDDTFESFLGVLRSLSEGDERVLYLADLQGGTPANAATYLVKEKNHICLTGISLPIILEILIARNANSSVMQAIERARGIAYESVTLIT